MKMENSGIGHACALAFSRYGASGLILADLNLKAAEAVVAECKAVAANAAFQSKAILMDITANESVRAALEDGATFLGRIDYCVNSAGVGVQHVGEVADADIEEFNNMLRVNVAGTFLITRAMSALMKNQEPKLIDPTSPRRGVTRGAIVNMGSASSFAATPNMIQYTAAKHAVLGITKNAALDNAAYCIRVNSVCPSWVDTPMLRKAMDDAPELETHIEKSVPLGRIALADEVADAVIFLCSPRASYAIGCSLILDGGTLLTGHA
ncbi:hypothetical protein O1611_g3105 [Lasiodiplodia mahajangana]|uniref:Uncharacterized protein n=1 Tax=Lasiodiplodia mahajangana TaxID=1108764 RepID=A0ACC2JSX5_9PEZI|nr:hypothetical protein O1611_g3105 [Lasiodiplodia mahajangana]